MVTRIRLGVLTLTLAIGLAARPDAATSPEIVTTVTLGSPATLEINARYSDPVELFPLLNGTLVFPLWLDVRNLSTGTQTFDVSSLQLRLGDSNGTPITLPPMNAGEAQRRLADDVKLNPVLKTIFRQPSGPWTSNTFDRDLRTGELKPGKSRSGYAFFLKPNGFQFNGVMALGTRRHQPELVPTSLVRTTPILTRGDSTTLMDSVYSALEKLPGGRSGRDLIRSRPFGQSYALLFGISTYVDPKYNLPGPASDVARMEAYLDAQGFDQVVTVLDGKVKENTLRDIQAHFGNKITAQDRLLVYYAGHGQRTDDGRGYLLLSEGTRVPMGDFMAWIRSVKIKHLLVLLDACYSGSVIGGTNRDVLDNIDSPTFDKLLRLASEGSRFVVTAGTDREQAHEHPRWRGGLFTNAVLGALQQKTSKPGLVTTYQMFTNVRDYMFEQEREFSVTAQTPLIQDLGYGGDGKSPAPASQGEFVFVRGK